MHNVSATVPVMLYSNIGINIISITGLSIISSIFPETAFAGTSRYLEKS